VPVRYDPADPSVAMIDTIIGRGTWIAGLASVAGLALIVTAIIHV